MADEQPQLHDLTKLLLSRLESYPEEFVAGRWEYEIGVVNTVEAGDNRKALNDALDNHRMNLTLQKALQKLLVPENKEDDFTTDDVRYKATLRMPLLGESFTRATYDVSTQTFILIREDGTTYQLTREYVEDDPDLVAAIRELMRR